MLFLVYKMRKGVAEMHLWSFIAAQSTGTLTVLIDTLQKLSRVA